MTFISFFDDGKCHFQDLEGLVGVGGESGVVLTVSVVQGLLSGQFLGVGTVEGLEDVWITGIFSDEGVEKIRGGTGDKVHF